MTLEIEGIRARSPLRALIARKITTMFDGQRTQPRMVRIGFVDENGPKGGVDIRCGITVEVPRRPTIHAEDRAPTDRLAFDAALDALAKRLTSDRDRLRTVRRRPKKYYLAKRLLMPDESLPSPTEPRRPRRSTTRRSA
jgi:ribosome-associated translation inhibitor RaiA